MNDDADIPALERVTFFDGQRLTAADLAAVQHYQQELRWLHNRSLHGWGIALGLTVKGDKGDRQVTVAPGYGLDCLGHEIILSEARVLPVPPVAGMDGGPAIYYLTIAYQSDEELAGQPAETRQGVCLPGGSVRLPEEPRFAWRRGAAEVSTGHELILAEASIQNCQLSKAVSGAPRRSARPVSQPYIAAGQTTPGQTVWTYLGDSSGDGAFGVSTTVDTSGARFRLKPQYLAHVAGQRIVAEPGGPVEFPDPGQLVEGYVRIVNPAATGFEVQVLMPRELFAGKYNVNPNVLFDKALPPRLRTPLNWHVVWMGVEG